MTKHIFTALGLSLMAAPAFSDTITGDLTVRNHLCVGSDCLDGGTEPFGLEDFKIKQRSPWIKFEDTSPDLPTNDWQLRINGQVNNIFENFVALDNLDEGTTPFRVDGLAPNNALRLHYTGRIGMGTGIPQSSIHMSSGTPSSVRFEIDGSTGGQPLTWEMVGNYNFFIADRTNFTAPFSILSGDSNNHALIIAEDGDIGLGTTQPQAKLHVAGTSMLIKNNGRVNFTLSDTSDPGPDFRTQLTAGTARFSFVGTGAPEMELFQSGDLAIRGRYISAGTTLTVPDYVFDEDYALRPLAEVQSFIEANSHLPEVPSAADIAQDGLDMTEMQMTLLKKIEELTLYTLEQEAKLAQMDTLKAELDALKARLETVAPAQD